MTAAPPAPALEPKQISLSYGMHRKQVVRLLGEPTFESIIGSLKRARAEYGDVMALYFEHDQLVSIVCTELTRNALGKLRTTLGDKVVLFNDDLYQITPQVPPNDDSRAMLLNHFFFATPQNSSSGDGESLHSGHTLVDAKSLRLLRISLRLSTEAQTLPLQSSLIRRFTAVSFATFELAGAGQARALKP